MVCSFLIQNKKDLKLMLLDSFCRMAACMLVMTRSKKRWMRCSSVPAWRIMRECLFRTISLPNLWAKVSKSSKTAKQKKKSLVFFVTRHGVTRLNRHNLYDFYCMKSNKSGHIQSFCAYFFAYFQKIHYFCNVVAYAVPPE